MGKALLRWPDLVAPTIEKLSSLGQLSAEEPWTEQHTEWESRVSDEKLIVIAKNNIVQAPAELKGLTKDVADDRLSTSHVINWAWHTQIMPFTLLTGLGAEGIQIANSKGWWWSVSASSEVLKSISLEQLSESDWSDMWQYYIKHWAYYMDSSMLFSLAMVKNQPYTQAMVIEESRTMAFPLTEGKSRSTVQGFWRDCKQRSEMTELEFAREWQLRAVGHQKFIERLKLRNSRKESRSKLLTQNVMEQVKSLFIEVHPWKN